MLQTFGKQDTSKLSGKFILTVLAQTSTVQQIFTERLFHKCPASEDLCNSIFAKPYLPENVVNCVGYHWRCPTVWAQGGKGRLGTETLTWCQS